MSTRRTGKKKPQPRQQLVAAPALTALREHDSQPPCIATAVRQLPTSPAVTLARQALSPIVKAATAVTAAASTLVMTPAMPAIPEDATITAANIDDDHTMPAPLQQSQQTPPATGDPILCYNTPKAVPAGVLPHNDFQPSHITDANLTNQHTLTPSHSLDDPATNEQLQMPLLVQLQGRLLRLYGQSSWRRARALFTVMLLPVLASILLHQGRLLSIQAQALALQQRQVAAQAQTLQDLQQQLQQASSQLPQLLRAAENTSSSLVNLTSEQTGLVEDFKDLSSMTVRLAQQMELMNGSTHAGEQAWQLLTAVSGTACARQVNSSQPAACLHQKAPGVPNASLVLEALGLHFLPEQQESKAHLKEQQHHVQQQLELMQNLPETIQQQVQQHMAAQLPPIDLALADCGGLIISHSPIDMDTFDMQWEHRTTSSHHAHSGTRGGIHVLQQRLWQLFQRPRFAQGGKAKAQTASRLPATLVGVHTGNGGLTLSTNSWQLLHKVLLRPASRLIPSACVPFTKSGQKPVVVEIQLPQLAYIHSTTLHAPAAANSSHLGWQVPRGALIALINSSECGGVTAPCSLYALPAAGQRDAGAPQSAHAPAEATAPTGSRLGYDGQPVASAGSTEHHGLMQPTADVLAATLKAGVSASVQERTLGDGAFSSGRAVIPADAASDAAADRGVQAAQGASRGVLADRVVVMVFGGLAVNDVCLGRISIQGRPTDPSGFC